MNKKAGRPKKPENEKGKYCTVIIYPQNSELFKSIPPGKKSWIVNQALELYQQSRPNIIENLQDLKDTGTPLD